MLTTTKSITKRDGRKELELDKLHKVVCNDTCMPSEVEPAIYNSQRYKQFRCTRNFN